MDFREIAAQAQARRQAAIPQEYLLPADKLKAATGSTNFINVLKESGHLSRGEAEIVHSEPAVILQNVKARTWSAVQVTEAFCKAASVAQQLTNCLTEILFPEALARAKQLDAHLESTGKTMGPLHGLPISLKDCLITPPHPSSIGMVCYGSGATDASEESTIVSIVQALGAIPYVKTNVPVAMMMPETINHVWGETVNPHHSGLSPGGSSGGEGALVAMYGSPLGIGTDIGGSIRIPSAFCGLYGLKPSYGRYPQGGVRSGIPGQEFVLSVNGPMARTLEALEMYSAAVLSSHPAASPWIRDPKCIPLPWRTESLIQPRGRKLRFGIVGPASDGSIHVHPPIERAVTLTRSALEAAGHTVLEWSTTSHAEIVRMLIEAFLLFGGEAIMPLLAQHNEPLFPYMAGYTTVLQALADAKSRGEPGGIDGIKMRAMNLARNKLMKEYLDRWQHDRIDGIIMACSPWTAMRRGVSNNPDSRLGYIGYTGWVNLLDLCSCTFPVTKADAKLDAPRGAAFQPFSDEDARTQADYDPAFYHGAPVSLQVVGQRLEEEKVLEMVGLVRDALRASGIS